MPELPEVETIKNELLPRVIGRFFARVTIIDPKVLRQPSVDEFCRKIVGQTVSSLKRQGKYLVFQLSSGKALIIHLKMTGALLLNPEQHSRHARALFQLDDGNQLILIDRRRLGAMWLVRDEATIIGKLGPEPLTTDFTAEIMASRLRGRQAPIKAVLLDQGFVAGIGNMYADEALFAARIHPLRKVNSLSSQEVQSLYHSIQDVLWSAIRDKGASIDTYVRPDGELGTAHFSFRVAHHRGELCPLCGTPIQRLPIRNRGTYFCPNCQKLS